MLLFSMWNLPGSNALCWRNPLGGAYQGNDVLLCSYTLGGSSQSDVLWTSSPLGGAFPGVILYGGLIL